MAEVDIPATDGVLLQGRLRRAVGDPVGAVLICHPHPAFGGHADVWLLPTIASRLADDGWVTLRLNFRGVEGSQGHQTAGEEEDRDVAGALDWLRDVAPVGPMAAVGWSFGAMLTLRAGDRLDAWVGIGAPTHLHEDVPMVGPIRGPVLPPNRTVIVGRHDQFFPPDTLGVLDPHRVIVIEDADHFLFDRDPEVADAVATALAADLLVTQEPDA